MKVLSPGSSFLLSSNDLERRHEGLAWSSTWAPQPHVSPAVQEDTLRPHVPVDDPHVVEVLQGQHHLGGVEPDHLLREPLALGQTPERADKLEK